MLSKIFVFGSSMKLGPDLFKETFLKEDFLKCSSMILHNDEGLSQV